MERLADAGRFAEADQRIGPEVIQCAGALVVNGGQIPLVVTGSATAQRFGIGTEIAAQRLRALAAGQLGRSGVQLPGGGFGAVFTVVGQHFAGGKQQRFVAVMDTPLGEGIKSTHGVDLVVKKLAADGVFAAGGKDVQNAAS